MMLRAFELIELNIESRQYGSSWLDPTGPPLVLRAFEQAREEIGSSRYSHDAVFDDSGVFMVRDHNKLTGAAPITPTGGGSVLAIVHNAEYRRNWRFIPGMPGKSSCHYANQWHARTVYNEAQCYVREYDALNEYGARLLHEGQLTDAFRFLHRAVVVDPRGVAARANLAVLYNEAHSYFEAAHELFLAIQLKPDSFVLYFNYGIALHESGRLRAAFVAFHMASALRPDLKLLPVFLSSLCRDLGDRLGVARHIEKAMVYVDDLNERDVLNLRAMDMDLGYVHTSVEDMQQVITTCFFGPLNIVFFLFVPPATTHLARATPFLCSPALHFYADFKLFATGCTRMRSRSTCSIYPWT